MATKIPELSIDGNSARFDSLESFNAARAQLDEIVAAGGVGLLTIKGEQGVRTVLVNQSSRIVVWEEM